MDDENTSGSSTESLDTTSKQDSSQNNPSNLREERQEGKDSKSKIPPEPNSEGSASGSSSGKEGKDSETKSKIPPEPNSEGSASGSSSGKEGKDSELKNKQHKQRSVQKNKTGNSSELDENEEVTEGVTHAKSLPPSKTISETKTKSLEGAPSNEAGIQVNRPISYKQLLKTCSSEVSTDSEKSSSSSVSSSKKSVKKQDSEESSEQPSQRTLPSGASFESEEVPSDSEQGSLQTPNSGQSARSKEKYDPKSTDSDLGSSSQTQESSRSRGESSIQNTESGVGTFKSSGTSSAGQQEEDPDAGSLVAQASGSVGTISSDEPDPSGILVDVLPEPRGDNPDPRILREPPSPTINLRMAVPEEAPAEDDSEILFRYAYYCFMTCFLVGLIALVMYYIIMWRYSKAEKYSYKPIRLNTVSRFGPSIPRPRL